MEATPVIQLIAASEGLSTLMFMASWMYLSLGLGNALVRLSVFSLVLKLVLVLFALPLGLVAVAAAGVVGAIIVLPIALWQVGRSAGLPTFVLLRQAGGILAVVSTVSILTAVTVGALDALADPLVVLIAACVQAAGFALAQLVPPVRRQTLRVWNMLALLRSPEARVPRE